MASSDPGLYTRTLVSDALQEVVARVCSIPVVFRTEPDETVRSLFEKSCYERFQKEVSVAAIQGYLATHQALVEAWIRYSEEKRTSSGWYLEGLVVGYYEPGKGMVMRDRFPDPARACAEFIKKEMETLSRLD